MGHLVGKVHRNLRAAPPVSGDSTGYNLNSRRAAYCRITATGGGSGYSA